MIAARCVCTRLAHAALAGRGTYARDLQRRHTATKSSTVSICDAKLLMVGDAPPDILAALAASCPAALVSWGYGAHAVPAELSPWRVDQPQQISARLIE
jgi:phosphoglycolate phosphatase-like HAD superfamily hydrolase